MFILSVWMLLLLCTLLNIPGFKKYIFSVLLVLENKLYQEFGLKEIQRHPRKLHVYYTTRQENPLRKMQSLIAIACKLLRIIYTILKKRIVYNADKMLKDIRRPAGPECLVA